MSDDQIADPAVGQNLPNGWPNLYPELPCQILSTQYKGAL
jgi:hypothetical protein